MPLLSHQAHTHEMKNNILEKSNEVFILVQSDGCDKVVA
jgi:hypothetical protein